MEVYRDLVQKVSIPAEKKIKQKDYIESGVLPVIDQGQALIGGYSNDTTKKIECSLPIVVFGDHTRAVKYIPFPFCAGADGIKVLKPKDNVVPLFLYYGTQYIISKMPNRGYARHYQYVEKEELDVPPLHEQERIVAKIEELLSQLDAGVETLNKTKAQLVVYRQAVLKDAFADITEKKPIREMTSIVTSGSRGWAQYYSDNGAKFIRIGNLTRNKIFIDLNDVQYVSLPERAEGLRTRLNPCDVLVSITADLGSIGLVPHDIGEAYVNQHIAMVRFNKPQQGEFYAWYLRSEFGQKDLLKNRRGGGKLGLGLDDIRDSKVPDVSDDEANMIVAKIDARLSVCDSIEKTVNQALQQAAAMRQSILKQAFEGGL